MDTKRDRLDVVIKQVFSRMTKLSPKPAVCPDEELLGAYLEGSLTQEERSRIEEHLVICSRCTESLILLSQLEGSYTPAQESFVTEEMVERIKGLVQPPQKPALWEKVSSWLPGFRPVPIMVAASVILAVVIFGIYNLYSPHGPSLVTSSIRIVRLPSEIGTRGTTPDHKEVEIQDGGVLHSGDEFRITFELQEEAYVYLLSLDSLGNLTKLFPEKDTGLHIKVKPHKTYIFPEQKRRFRLDDNTGQETLYLLASPEVIRDVDQRINQLQKSGIDKITKIFPGVKIQVFGFKHE